MGNLLVSETKKFFWKFILMIESKLSMIPHPMLGFGSASVSFGEVSNATLLNDGMVGWDNAQHVIGKIKDGSYRISQVCLMLYHIVRNAIPGEKALPYLRLTITDNAKNYIHYSLARYHMKGYDAEQIALVNTLFSKIEDYIQVSLHEFTQGHFDYIPVELDHA
jgi:hypothetical protein